MMNKTIYKQLDSRWSDKPYPTKDSSFGGNGCGCCACVHIAIEQEAKKNWTPESLRPWMIKQGFAYPGRGTTWEGIRDTLKYLGHKNVVWVDRNDPMSKAWAELNKGNRIGILLVDCSKTPDGTYWTSSGHYVAFTNYYVKNGKHYFFIKDSGFRDHDGEFCYETSIKGALPQLWIVERLDAPSPSPTPTPTPTNKYTGEYPAPKRYLEYGDKGSEVGKLQNYINWFFHEAYGKDIIGEPDNIYGPNTLNYCKLMQSELGFAWSECNGEVGKKTIARMKEKGEKGERPKQKPVTSNQHTNVIDVSYVQKSIDWEKVKASGIDGAIIRCGFRHAEGGKLDKDNMFESHIKGAHKAGLKVGVYFFTEAINAKEGKEEAAYTLNLIKKAGIGLSYPVGIDSENVFWYEGGKKCKGRANSGALSKAKRTEAIKAFCDEIKAQGYKPMIYASLTWFDDCLNMSKLPFDVWVAQYNDVCQYKGKYVMWQYTSTGRVNGISDVVDKNKCYI